MCQAVLSPNLTKKFQWEVSQIADNRFPCVMLLGGLSVNLNHLIIGQYILISFTHMLWPCILLTSFKSWTVVVALFLCAVAKVAFSNKPIKKRERENNYLSHIGKNYNNFKYETICAQSVRIYWPTAKASTASWIAPIASARNIGNCKSSMLSSTCFLWFAGSLAFILFLSCQSCIIIFDATSFINLRKNWN